MSKTQSFEKSVDSAGYVVVTPADTCERRSAEIDVPAGSTITPIRNAVLRKRSRLIIRHHENSHISEPSLNIGGRGVSASNGYPLKIGESIELPITPGVWVYGVLSSGDETSDVRTLETG